MGDEAVESISSNKFQIGCICALPFEMAAVTAMLDETYPSLDDQDPNDHNSYVLGRIHKHNVIVACLPGGSPGLSSAAIVATDMLRTFKSIRFGLMIGVGSGIPNLSDGKDIRLGDVAVSQPMGTSGGVLQYDRGTQGTSLVREGFLNSPPRILLSALTALQAQHLREDSLMSTYLERMIRKNPRMGTNGYSYPGSHRDQLFEPGSLHCGKRDSCDPCDQTQLVGREQRESKDPQIHYGTIASGSQLIMDAKKRDKLQQDFQAICIETEAAGLMNNFPCLIIRGICDYADTHSNHLWHRYSAATAAAFAKELLLFISPTSVDHVKPFQVADFKLQELSTRALLVNQEQLAIGKQQLAVSQGQHFLAEQSRESQEEHRLRDCHRTFKTSNYEEHKDINRTRTPGTCRWALNHPKFEQWMKSTTDDLLWVSGNPGCGKSVLSKFLIDDVLRGESRTICYFFFKDNPDQDNLNVAFCAMLHQLFSHCSSLRWHALEAWESNGDKLRDETKVLWDIILAATKDPDAGNILFVLDGLDECRDQDHGPLIQRLSSFYKASNKAPNGCHVKFLVTSRAYGDIEFEFNREQLPMIRLAGEDESDIIREEINMVMNDRIGQLGKDLQLSAHVLNKIQEKLVSMEHRTYLWLHLTIESIYDSYKSGRLDANTIQTLPSSVEEAYEKMLNMVDLQHREDVKTIFHIIIGARRPLSVAEASDAFRVATKSYEKYDSKMNPLHFETTIRQLCKLFIFIEHSKIYLIHQTAKEFLVKKEGKPVSRNEWKGCLDMQESNDLMTRICINYLLNDDIPNYREQIPWVLDYITAELGLSQDQIVQSRHLLQPYIDGNVSWNLFRYAAENWAAHAREIRMDPQLLRDACRLYDTGHPRFSRWFDMFQAANPQYPLVGLNAVKLAAFNGHLDLLKHLIIGRESQARDSRSRNFDDDWAKIDEDEETALAAAAMGGQEETLSFLLDNWPNLRIGKADRGAAVLKAASHGHRKIMEFMMDSGADRVIQMKKALLAAVAGSQLLLISYLIDIGAEFGSALPLACELGDVSVVQLLLDKGANINTRSEKGLPLQAAVVAGQQAIVQLLIDQGADIDAPINTWGTPLQAAAALGYQHIVQLLIEKGADMTLSGGKYGNALRAAVVAAKSAPIVKIFVEKYSRDRKSSISLSARVKMEVVWLLMQHEGQLKSAFYAATTRGMKDHVELLLDMGADLNTQGRKYGTALQAASYLGYRTIVECLIDKGADVNAIAGKNGTALQAAVISNHISIVQVLLASGADVNAPGGEFGNALQTAAALPVQAQGPVNPISHRTSDADRTQGERGPTRTTMANKDGLVRLLLTYNANINAVGGLYQTALQAAVATKSPKIALMLLDYGADASIRGGYYGSALQAAAVQGDIMLTKILIDKGADLDVQDGHFGSALRAATAKGYQPIMKLLKSRGARQ